MTETATLVGTVSQGNDHFQQHYKLSDIGDVIVSQVWTAFTTETYIFPCDSAGEITDWCELSGSRKGVVTPHDLLIENGYVVTQ